MSGLLSMPATQRSTSHKIIACLRLPGASCAHGGNAPQWVFLSRAVGATATSMGNGNISRRMRAGPRYGKGGPTLSDRGNAEGRTWRNGINGVTRVISSRINGQSTSNDWPRTFGRTGSSVQRGIAPVAKTKLAESRRRPKAETTRSTTVTDHGTVRGLPPVRRTTGVLGPRRRAGGADSRAGSSGCNGARVWTR